MVNLDEVLTFSEAAEKWGLADGKSIRKAVERNRFETYEIKKSGNVWLTTYDAMIRVFGAPRRETSEFYYFDLFNLQRKDLCRVLDYFYEKASKMIENNELVSIIESRDHPERIVCILKTQEELDGCINRLKVYFKTISA